MGFPEKRVLSHAHMWKTTMHPSSCKHSFRISDDSPTDLGAYECNRDITPTIPLVQARTSLHSLTCLRIPPTIARHRDRQDHLASRGCAMRMALWMTT